MARDCDHDGELPFTKKTDVCKIVEMLKEFLVATQGSKDETTELEELASKLSLSETHQQVGPLFLLIFVVLVLPSLPSPFILLLVSSSSYWSRSE